MVKEEAYSLFDISLFNIRNRNETRVIELLPEVLTDFPNFNPELLDLQDIYALTLNKLKPRYAQECSLVLKEPVSDDTIRSKLREAIHKVQRNPNH